MKHLQKETFDIYYSWKQKELLPTRLSNSDESHSQQTECGAAEFSRRGGGRGNTKNKASAFFFGVVFLVGWLMVVWTGVHAFFALQPLLF